MFFFFNFDIAINRDAWNRQTQSEAVLKEAPSIALLPYKVNWV
ncbi:hypothetical protein [Argonema antarcticum]|nr:hypothetical protein [Argonema antarcticum]